MKILTIINSCWVIAAIFMSTIAQIKLFFVLICICALFLIVIILCDAIIEPNDKNLPPIIEFDTLALSVKL